MKPPSPGGRSWWSAALAVLAVAAVVWAYAPSLGGEVLWDDDGHLVRPELREAPHEEPRAHQEDQRQRGLAYYQGVPPPVAAPGRAAPSVP